MMLSVELLSLRGSGVVYSTVGVLISTNEAGDIS